VGVKPFPATRLIANATARRLLFGAASLETRREDVLDTGILALSDPRDRGKFRHVELSIVRDPSGRVHDTSPGCSRSTTAHHRPAAPTATDRVH
jgi:hypothetical protein